MTIFQADVARAVGFGPMTVGRLLRTMDRCSRPFTDEDALAVLMVDELKALGMTAQDAGKLIGQFSSELRFILKSRSNRCWLTFIRTERGGSSVMACCSIRHLETTLDAFVGSKVISLHEIAARASERLATLKVEKVAINA